MMTFQGDGVIWIGLTGGIATGKSTVSQFLTSQNYTVIDADQISKEVVGLGSEGLAKVIQDFGPEYLRADGSLDRAKMANLIFSDPEMRTKLENIVHPLVQQKVNQQKNELIKQGQDIAFYDVPLLFEKNLEKNFDFTVLVSCRPELQIERLMKRDKLNMEQAKQRIANQLSLKEKTLRASYVLENNSTVKDLELQVLNLIAKLKSSSQGQLPQNS